MSGINYLVDTNFLIHTDQRNKLVEPFLSFNIAISCISEMELLDVFSISKEQKLNMKRIVDECFVIEFNPEIKYLAINLKQKYKLKLADAIIAATAIHLELPFITSDGDFKAIKELELIFLEK